MSRITIASTYAADGGAARAALRLFRALRGHGAEAQLLCQFAGHPEAGVEGPPDRNAKLWAHAGRLWEDRIGSRARRPSLYSAATRSWGVMARRLAESDGVLHLHWVQKGFLSIEDIGRLRRPFFWTFHDMWPMTDGVHYGDEASMRLPPAGLARSVWQRKLRAWADLDVTVVTSSRWLGDLAKQSPFFQHRPIHVIPTAVELDLYRPLESAWARHLLGVPAGKKIIFFGAMDATSDPRKGYDLLVNALDGWKARRDVHLMIAGSSEAPGLTALGYTWTALGHLADDVSLVAAYNAADVVVVPSRQENLSNMLLEALACGVPCVGFDLGGNPDVILPGQTGALARPEDPASLRQALADVLFGGRTTEQWRQQTRDFAVTHLAPSVVAERHLALYRATPGVTL